MHNHSVMFPSRENTMASAREQMVRIIEARSEDSSWGEILRELAFGGMMIERGLEDSEAGRTIGDEEMRERID